MLRSSFALVLVACVSPSSTREPSEICTQEVYGDRSQLTTPIAAPTGPQIDSPKACGTGANKGEYIRVHGHGVRMIEMGGAAKQQCTEPPATPSGCVFADDFGRAVIARLGAQQIDVIGLGLGACGDSAGNYDAWNMSISVNDWRRVDAAILAIDEELRAYDVGNSFGVTVRAITCAEPE